jgi:hypothetical protein
VWFSVLKVPIQPQSSGDHVVGISLFSVLKSWLLKEFLFLGTISVTDSEVIAFYMRSEASFDAEKAPASLRDSGKMGATEVLWTDGCKTL